MLLAQATPNAQTVFYITLLVIFITAIITTIVTKWARDKCLRFFHGYHVTLERYRGQTMWGRLKVFSSGIEIVYDHPYVDPQGRQKTSFMFYQQELDAQVLSLFRFDGELTPEARRQRQKQVQQTFNPRFFRRAWRGFRNLINTLRDAFQAAIGAAVQQFQRTTPTGTLIGSQTGAITAAGQTLLGRFANAYEPLLEQYIGQPVILEVADPINPNNVLQEFPGYLADYTQQFIALFNVDHSIGDALEITLPDLERGDLLPPLPNPPAPGAPPPVLPPAQVDQGISIRLDGGRMRIQNTRTETLTIKRLERAGFDPLELGMILPPNATLNLPARDARAGKLLCAVVRGLDVVAPRKLATIRHAGVQLERKGITDELGLELDRLPLVSRLFSDAEDDGRPR